MALDSPIPFVLPTRIHRWVDAHHIEHWVDGGATRARNLVLLFTTHHRIVHEGAFLVRGDVTNQRFARPDGTVTIAPGPGRPDGPLPPSTPAAHAAPNYRQVTRSALPRAA